MFAWNVIVTVLPGPGHESALLARLREFGEFHHTQFKDVCLGKVADIGRLLEALRHSREAGEAWLNSMARVIPVELTFRFTPETLAEQFARAAAAFADRIRDGSSFYVRLERRGFIGKIDTPLVEQEVADHLFALARGQAKNLRVTFEDPDIIVAAETVGEECGVALLTRELRQRYPFVQTR